MNALLIETCTERGMFALFKAGLPLLIKQLPFGLQSSQFLLSELSTALQETAFDLHSLDYIAVGVGPGSYTGMRVGAIAAKAVSFACSIPLIGVPTLESFSPIEEGHFAVLIDAKISGVYLQAGEKRLQSIIRTPPLVCSLQEAQLKLNGTSLIVTPYANQLRQKFALAHPNLELRWTETAPSAELMYVNAYQKFIQNQFSTNGDLELLYMRKTQAEIEKEKKLDQM